MIESSNSINPMKMTLLKDRRTIGLLNRVSEDVSQLKGDIGRLLGDTTKRAIPEGAREVSKLARQQLSVGQAYARSRMTKVKMPSNTCSLSVAGGVLLVGALAFGYFLMKDRIALSCARRTEPDPDEQADSAA
ncbi:MAG: hypothetical protein ABIT37_02945 [Luteolibacter sp.]